MTNRGSSRCTLTGEAGAGPTGGDTSGPTDDPPWWPQQQQQQQQQPWYLRNWYRQKYPIGNGALFSSHSAKSTLSGIKILPFFSSSVIFISLSLLSIKHLL
jgi:hypothetical protein